MVKGVTRQVVVVQGPDRKWFEQAIFLLREETEEVPPEEQVLQQAQAVAEDYLLRASPRARRWQKWRLVWAALAGGAAASLLWWAGILPLPF